MPIPLPFGEELQAVCLHPTIQYLFNLEVLFTLPKDRWGWKSRVSTRDGVMWCRCQLDDVTQQGKDSMPGTQSALQQDMGQVVYVPASSIGK